MDLSETPNFLLPVIGRIIQSESWRQNRETGKEQCKIYVCMHRYLCHEGSWNSFLGIMEPVEMLLSCCRRDCLGAAQQRRMENMEQYCRTMSTFWSNRLSQVWQGVHLPFLGVTNKYLVISQGASWRPVNALLSFCWLPQATLSTLQQNHYFVS